MGKYQDPGSATQKKKPNLQTDAELMDQVLGATRPLTRPAASKRITPEEHVEDVHRRMETAAAAPGAALFDRLFAGLEKTRFFLNPAQYFFGVFGFFSGLYFFFFLYLPRSGNF
jgi:hypothetical protein